MKYIRPFLESKNDFDRHLEISKEINDILSPLEDFNLFPNIIMEEYTKKYFKGGYYYDRFDYNINGDHIRNEITKSNLFTSDTLDHFYLWSIFHYFDRSGIVRLDQEGILKAIEILERSKLMFNEIDLDFCDFIDENIPTKSVGIYHIESPSQRKFSRSFKIDEIDEMKKYATFGYNGTAASAVSDIGPTSSRSISLYFILSEPGIVVN